MLDKSNKKKYYSKFNLDRTNIFDLNSIVDLVN